MVQWKKAAVKLNTHLIIIILALLNVKMYDMKELHLLNIILILKQETRL